MPLNKRRTKKAYRKWLDGRPLTQQETRAVRRHLRKINPLRNVAQALARGLILFEKAIRSFAERVSKAFANDSNKAS